MDLVININKPKGITSHEAVSKVKKILKAKKAGHTGTLDPAATGVLLVCTNRATRLASYFSSLDKEYSAVIKLGEATDTQDAEGTVIEKSNEVKVTKSVLMNTLKSFEGKILQKPPMFSALKHKGKPLYKYAKKGIDIPRKSRNVYIHHIELLDMELPYARFKTVCSKGTYIRTLCDDAGKKLGIGAHLFELRRTAIGSFKIKDAKTIEELTESSTKNKGIYTMDSALFWMPELKIEQSQVKSVMNGNPIKISACISSPDDPETGLNGLVGTAGIKIKSPDNEFLAVGSFSAGKNTVKMDVVFRT